MTLTVKRALIGVLVPITGVRGVAYASTASHLFGVIFVTALSIVSAASEERDANPVTDSPWTKFCLHETCYVGRGRHSYCNGLIAEVTLVARRTETGKLLSVAVPARINPDRPIRITIDRNAPVSRPVSKCDIRGCWAEHEAGAELVEQLKQGQMLVLEAVNPDGTPNTVTISLAGFAEAYDGPPQPLPEMQEASKAEMEALREQQKRAQEERRARCGPSP
jgi:invasion protein IalB